MILKIIIAVVLWFFAHAICERFPFEWTPDKDNLQPYDYYRFYSLVYMMVFLIIILI